MSRTLNVTRRGRGTRPRKFTITVEVPQEDDVRVPHKTRGLKTGVGIFTFLAMLFDLNEHLPREKKMTDLTIARLLVQEFAHLLEKNRSSIRKVAEGKLKISYYRALYNAGRMTQGRIPNPKSRRYGPDGLPYLGGATYQDTRQTLLEMVEETHAHSKPCKRTGKPGLESGGSGALDSAS
ncbi:MAG: hypothetical protein JRI66_09135 [Deltaproteobacteria bacterium]|nr:hypothetical protein [Deltaproteobacteria bacterium]